MCKCETDMCEQKQKQNKKKTKQISSLALINKIY